MPKTPENRDATVVYPGTSPRLLLAYRIFGPGYDSLEALAEQRKTIINPSPNLTQEGEGEVELTRLGEDLASSMKLDTGQVMSAYKTYKKEIKRMNKADRNHKRKRGQLDGADGEDDGEFSSSSPSSDSDGSEETDPSSNDQISSSIEEEDDDDEAEQPSPKRKKTLDELLDAYLAPSLWLPRDTALHRTQSHRAALEEMHTTIGTLIEIYTTRLPYTRPLAQAMHHLVTNFMRWRSDAARTERLITLHDNSSSSTPAAAWVSPDTKDVTYGPKVTQALCMFWELDAVVGGMRRSLAHCEHLRGRLLAAGTSELRRRFYHELVFNMRRFASMCVIEELRAGFVGELEEERRQWSPESSPDSEEYKTDFEDFSSDSESEGEGKGKEDQETRTARDTAEPVQE